MAKKNTDYDNDPPDGADDHAGGPIPDALAAVRISHETEKRARAACDAADAARADLDAATADRVAKLNALISLLQTDYGPTPS